MSQNGMQGLCCSGYVSSLSFSDFEFCEHCVYGKQTKSVHQRQPKKILAPLHLVHSDVCGPMPVRSLGGAAYFVTFIDDATRRKVWAYPIARKSDAFTVFQKWLALAEN